MVTTTGRKISLASYFSPLGELLLGVLEDQICLCDWKYRKQRKAIDDRILKLTAAQFENETHPLHIECRQQLDAYFAKQLTTFQLPYTCWGTTFQQEVWQALTTIPYGSTRSYAQLTEQLTQSTEAVRAVAAANGANALSILIPCHRIIGANGDLVGYAGGLTAKRKLLALESGVQQGDLFVIS